MSQWPCDTAWLGHKRGGGRRGPALWIVRRTSVGMSRRVTFADDVKPAYMRRTKIDFWDGMKHGSSMPKITARGMGTPGTAAARLMCIWGFPSGLTQLCGHLWGVSVWGWRCDGSFPLPPKCGAGGAGRLAATRYRA